jgi:hypothetical protein
MDFTRFRAGAPGRSAACFPADIRESAGARVLQLKHNHFEKPPCSRRDNAKGASGPRTTGSHDLRIKMLISGKSEINAQFAVSHFAITPCVAIFQEHFFGIFAAGVAHMRTPPACSARCPNRGCR